MLRITVRRLSLSPFALYMKDLSRAGMYPKGRNHIKIASKMYRALPPADRRRLVARARSTKNPKLDSYNRLQKKYSSAFPSLSPDARAVAVGKIWSEKKATGTVKLTPLKKKVIARSARVAVKASKKARKPKTAKKKSSIKRRGNITLKRILRRRRAAVKPTKGKGKKARKSSKK